MRRHVASYSRRPTAATAFGRGCGELHADALFIWGRRDRLVPIAFARHVAEALPAARHLELDCSSIFRRSKRPRQTHAAIPPAFPAVMGDRLKCCALWIRASRGPEMCHMGRGARGEQWVGGDRLWLPSPLSAARVATTQSASAAGS